MPYILFIFFSRLLQWQPISSLKPFWCCMCLRRNDQSVGVLLVASPLILIADSIWQCFSAVLLFCLPLAKYSTSSLAFTFAMPQMERSMDHSFRLCSPCCQLSLYGSFGPALPRIFGWMKHKMKAATWLEEVCFVLLLCGAGAVSDCERGLIYQGIRSISKPLFCISSTTTSHHSATITLIGEKSSLRISRWAVSRQLGEEKKSGVGERF